MTKYRITFVRTKGKKNRSIPISKELYEEIMALDGFNFFTDCYFQFLSVMEKTSIVLPRGQLTHVLRHTFVKWHTEFGHLNRGDMLTSEQHRCSNEKKKF
ncbi:integrase domain protein [Shigella flexneri 1485-80]|nr:integrase domain protein [Shigella flexneri 1485-80]